MGGDVKTVYPRIKEKRYSSQIKKNIPTNTAKKRRSCPMTGGEGKRKKKLAVVGGEPGMKKNKFSCIHSPTREKEVELLRKERKRHVRV